MAEIKKINVKDDKLKPIYPSLRLKKRFVRVRVLSEKKFDFKTLSYNLIDNILLYMGIIDFGKSGIWILRDKFNEENQELILKVSTKSCDKLIGVLSLIQNINKKDVKIETIRVSGTLKGVFKK